MTAIAPRESRCCQGRAIDRVHCHVGNHPGPRADFLAVVEHGSFVLLALPNDDLAIDVQGRKMVTHAVDRGLIYLLLVTTT